MSLNMVLNWITNADKNARFIFLNSVLDCFPEEDLPEVGNIVGKPRKRKLSEGCNDLKELLAKESKKTTVPWWSYWWQSGKIRSLDTEMVSVPINPDATKLIFQNVNSVFTSGKGKRKFKQVVASVSVVDFNMKEIYSAKVYHEPGSFLVNPGSQSVNGFNADSFIAGKPLGVVLSEVKRLLINHLIIMCGAKSDLAALDVNIFDYEDVYNGDYFDLQEHWWCGDREPLKLKHIYEYYFHETFQDGESHDPEKDAIGTMRIFKEIYPQEKKINVDIKHNDESYDCIRDFFRSKEDYSNSD